MQALTVCTGSRTESANLLAPVATAESTSESLKLPCDKTSGPPRHDSPMDRIIKDVRTRAGDNCIGRALRPMPEMALKLGEPAFHYPSVDTTMRLAADRAREGCPEGTIVTAACQTAGRGRLGRSWLSKPGLGLYLSIVLRPSCRPDDAPMLTLVAGLGVCEALQRVAGVQCDIRWPNDILIRERKCCGILVEMEASDGRVDHVIAGVGINLNHREFPRGLRSEATSLRIETGRDWTRESVLRPVLDSIGACYELRQTEGDGPILAAFQHASSYAFGRRVVIEAGKEAGAEPRRGVTAGLDSKGLLLVRSDDGSVAPVLAGSVRPDPSTI